MDPLLQLGRNGCVAEDSRDLSAAVVVVVVVVVVVATSSY